MEQYNKLIKELKKLGNPIHAKHSQRFFKTDKGEYGEGDIFLGITMPVQRKVAQKYLSLTLKDIQKLINSKIHEHRMVGLLIVTYKYKKANDLEKKKLFDFYIKNAKKINNWDLVDVTASHIVGQYLISKPRNILYKFSKSKNLWEKRISIISTFAFIRINDFKDTFCIAEVLLKDEHDLIHKAVGWMLREVGKRDQKLLEKFLDNNIKSMPRTMLRYTIERFDEEKKKYYMYK